MKGNESVFAFISFRLFALISAASAAGRAVTMRWAVSAQLAA
jgi:hypothetical protein